MNTREPLTLLFNNYKPVDYLEQIYRKNNTAKYFQGQIDIANYQQGSMYV